MPKKIKVGNRWIGEGEPCFVIAEIGINHNGSLESAKRLIDSATLAGCDAVKFQKRTPELCVPAEQRDIQRETPWGIMSYMEYRRRVEFSLEDYQEIDRYCRERGILWFASCWDAPSVDFMEAFSPPCYKVASACLTDDDLLRAYRRMERPVLLSTGMSTLEQIDHAVEILGTEDLVLLHCNSTYPAKPEDLNLKVMDTLSARYGVPVGYSGHEVGLATSLAAATLGACVIERHITLDRAMWGTDQAASIEPQGISRLVRDIRAVKSAMGDGVKRVYPTEIPVMKKLRRVVAV